MHPPPGFDPGTPVYLQIARLLQRQIGDGLYPVGSLLPKEIDLALQMGVSRQTVRQAIAQLRQRNLVSARKGIGTRVEAQHDDLASRFTVLARHELFDFLHETELRFDFCHEIDPKPALLAEMGARPGRRFVHAGGGRHYPGQPQALCFNEIYLDHRLRSLIDDRPVLRSALFTLVESQTGDRVREIHQQIRAGAMPSHAAALLGVAPGAPCMKLTRRFLASGGRLLEYAVQYYPADAFVYQTTLVST